MTHSEILWQGITAIVTILTVVAAILKSRRQSQGEHVETGQKIDAVQTAVNGHTEALRKRVDQLTAALSAAGVAVPDAQDGS